jgi:hypothetical protein
MRITSSTTKAELVAGVQDLPEYMAAAGLIIGVLKRLDSNVWTSDEGVHRSVAAQRLAALRLAREHFNL